MRVKILKDPIGLYNLVYEIGQVVDLPDSQAGELIETGHAEKTKEPLTTDDGSQYHTLTDNNGNRVKVETAESKAKKEQAALKSKK